jgi:hypothetical protein
MTDDRELRNRLAEAATQIEATSDEDLTWIKHKNPPTEPTAVYSVRLPADRIDELRALAEARGTRPTSLLRAWALEKLDSAARRQDRNTERWERDMRATTDHLRALLDERPGA